MKILPLKESKNLDTSALKETINAPLGEIDLIARHGDCLVFIEIKTRKGRDTGYAKEAVNLRKMRQISKTALNYMKENDCYDTKSRFDVVAVSINNGKPDIEVIQNAFELVY